MLPALPVLYLLVAYVAAQDPAVGNGINEEISNADSEPSLRSRRDLLDTVLKPGEKIIGDVVDFVSTLMPDIGDRDTTLPTVLYPATNLPPENIIEENAEVTRPDNENIISNIVDPGFNRPVNSDDESVISDLVDPGFNRPVNPDDESVISDLEDPGFNRPVNPDDESVISDLVDPEFNRPVNPDDESAVSDLVDPGLNRPINPDDGSIVKDIVESDFNRPVYPDNGNIFENVNSESTTLQPNETPKTNLPSTQPPFTDLETSTMPSLLDPQLSTLLPYEDPNTNQPLTQPPDLPDLTIVSTLPPSFEPEVTLVTTQPSTVNPEYTLPNNLSSIIYPESTLSPTQLPTFYPGSTLYPTLTPTYYPGTAPPVPTIYPESTTPSLLDPNREPSTTPSTVPDIGSVSTLYPTQPPTLYPESTLYPTEPSTSYPGTYPANATISPLDPNTEPSTTPSTGIVSGSTLNPTLPPTLYPGSTLDPTQPPTYPASTLYPTQPPTYYPGSTQPEPTIYPVNTTISPLDPHREPNTTPSSDIVSGSTLYPTQSPTLYPESTLYPTQPPTSYPGSTLYPTEPSTAYPGSTLSPVQPPITAYPEGSTSRPDVTYSPLEPNREPSTVTPLTQNTTTTTPVPLNPHLEPAEIDGFGCINGDGYYGIMGQCDSFIECNMLRPRTMVCPDGLLFNPYKPYPYFPCSYPSEVQCEGVYRQPPKPTNQCPQQYGYYTAPGGECSKYIMCQRGKATLMTCPHGLVFNEVLSSCDWPVNVPHCDPDAFKGFLCPIPEAYEDEFNFVITMFRYGNECTSYIACERGAPRYLSCPIGLAFLEEEQTCVHPSLVPGCGGVL